MRRNIKWQTKRAPCYAKTRSAARSELTMASHSGICRMLFCCRPSACDAVGCGGRSLASSAHSLSETLRCAARDEVCCSIAINYIDSNHLQKLSLIPAVAQLFISEEDYDAFCLAYMFTYRDFEMGTLGLAWTGDLKNAGGVCEKNGVSCFSFQLREVILLISHQTAMAFGYLCTRLPESVERKSRLMKPCKCK